MLKIFDKISIKNQEKILKYLHAYTVNTHKDKKIVDYFNDDDEIGIIKSGSIEIIQNNYNGTKTILYNLGENDLIGSKFIYLKNDEYEIITKEETEIIIFNYSEIERYDDISDKSYCQFIKNLLVLTNDILTAKIERIEILTKKTIRSKLL